MILLMLMLIDLVCDLVSRGMLQDRDEGSDLDGVK